MRKLSRSISVRSPAYERVLGEEHTDPLINVNNLAALYFEQRDWVRAAQFLAEQHSAFARREQLGTLSTAQAPAGKKKSETEQHSSQFRVLIKAVYRLTPEGGTPDAKNARETFETAQWVQGSEAAASLAQMAVRSASRGTPALRRKCASARTFWRNGRDTTGCAIHGWGLPADKRSAQAEAENNARLAAIDARIQQIDKELAAKFPGLRRAREGSAPLSVEEVQAQLAANEALVFFLDTSEAKPTPKKPSSGLLPRPIYAGCAPSLARRR